MSHDDDFDDGHGFDDLDEDSVEARVWQLLLLINPGDEDSALQQFADYRDAAAATDPQRLVPIALVAQAIDWRAGFIVEAHDMRALMQAIDELAARFNLAIDWNGDPDDDEFFDDMDPPELFSIAYDRLAEFGYTLWAWETDGDSCAGWISLTRDGEALREVAGALHVNLRLGSDVG